MNRGRRRGGPGLTGLRDGVKRRLFDPHLVPTKLDERGEINRLLPVVATVPPIPSRLASLRKAKQSETAAAAAGLESVSCDQPTGSQCSLFRSKAMFELAFRKGPFYQSLPESSVGIELGRFFGTSSAKEKPAEPVLLAHLLLAHDALNKWSGDSQLADLADPEAWYPTELVEFTRPGKTAIRRQKGRQKSSRKSPDNKDGPDVIAGDLEQLVPDRLIEQSTELAEQGEGDAENKPEIELDRQDQDSDATEDARWNGEVNADADPEELDEEELDNDYCQTYFDNGEGDLSDAGLAGGDDDDDGMARYYD